MAGIYSDCSSREVNNHFINELPAEIQNSGGSTLGGAAQAPPNRGEPPNLSVLLTHCGQLILRKLSTFDDNICQILRLECTKFGFRWGSAADPAGRSSLQRSPDPIAVFKGDYF